MIHISGKILLLSISHLKFYFSLFNTRYFLFCLLVRSNISTTKAAIIHQNKSPADIFNSVIGHRKILRYLLERAFTGYFHWTLFRFLSPPPFLWLFLLWQSSSMCSQASSATQRISSHFFTVLSSFLTLCPIQFQFILFYFDLLIFLLLLFLPFVALGNQFPFCNYMNWSFQRR